MLKAGLTGSIAVGKSFVLEIFRGLGCFVLDADRTARDVVKPKSKGLTQIVKTFGKDVLDKAGVLDRKKLGLIVFADEAKRQLLNSIVHPLVIERQDRWLKKCENEDPGGIAIVDAALMIESGNYKRFDKLIVVWCDAAIQLKRLKLRDKISASQVQKRIDSQMPQEEKKSYADFLIDTSNGFDDTRRQTIEIFEELRILTL